MTILGDRVRSEPTPALVTPTARKRSLGSAVVGWVTTTDHKVIGNLYLITATVAVFVVRGRDGAGDPRRVGLRRTAGRAVLEQYNQLFTMHGTIMLLLFATPLVRRLRQRILPLQLGAPAVAFPRLNMLSYWLFLFGGLIVGGLGSSPRGRSIVRLVRVRPAEQRGLLAGGRRRPVADGLGDGRGLGTILGSVNFVTTIFCMRAPGMTMFRMPIFTWTIFVTSILVLLAFPVLAAALAMAFIDRRSARWCSPPRTAARCCGSTCSGSSGTRRSTSSALPFFGIASEIIPVFSRKPIFGYKGLVFATLAIGALSMAVWAHHLYVTGSVLPAVLRDHDDADRGAHRREVLQLDRHDVEGLRVLRHADAVDDGFHGHVPLRWA